MDYRSNALREIQAISKAFPEYTLGEVLYSALRLTKAKTLNDLMKLSDEKIYTAVNKSIEVEEDA